ncbi:hypothetical protein ACFL60_02965 [Candidatus Omnitrophota bacterium]
MLDCITYADKLAQILETEIKDFPEGFFDSFLYTQTGNNLTHPQTLGIISRCLWNFPEITNVGIDVRLKSDTGAKFQPDIVGFDSTNKEVVFIDYESPNSSDARIPIKDFDAYLLWRQKTNSDAPYIIITTLPNHDASDWELRYTSKGRTNEKFRGKKSEIQKNPYRFWYNYYNLEIKKRKVKNIALINIEDKHVRRQYP